MLISFQESSEISDDDIDEKFKQANKQFLSSDHLPRTTFSPPYPVYAEKIRKDLGSSTYKTREERFKNLLTFMRTDLSFNTIIETYRTAGEPGTAWDPDEMDKTMDKVAYLRACVRGRRSI
jgi:hypothetical protein